MATVSDGEDETIDDFVPLGETSHCCSERFQIVQDDEWNIFCWAA